MRVGVTILPEYRWPDAAPRWRAAQEYGFDHAWTFDHLGWRSLVEGPWFSAVPTLTAAASVTSTIGLGTLVSTPNTRHPLNLARDVLALDDISGGRFTLGLGAGAAGGYDSEVYGGKPLTKGRTERFAEFVELTDALLTGNHVDYDGTYLSAVNARSAPGCLQRPRVPFVVAANGPRAMAVAAAHGQGWITTGGSAENLEQWWQTLESITGAFDEAEARCGRPPRGIRRFLQSDGAPVYSLCSVSSFEEFFGRAQQLGFTDLVVPWPRSEGVFAGSPEVLDDVAGILAAHRRHERTSDRP